MLGSGFDFDSDFSLELGEYNIARVKKFERVWKMGTGGSLTTSMVPNGGAVFFGCADHHLYSVDPATGKMNWKFRTEDVIAEGDPAISEGVVYAGSHDRNMYAVGASDGKLRWKFATADKVSSGPLVHEGVVYFGSKDRNVYALDAHKGTLLWKFETSDDIISHPVIWKDLLLIGSYDRNLYCLEKGTGRMAWKFCTQGEIHNANQFAARDGVIYFSSFDDYLRAVDIESGALLWKARLGQYGCTAAPVLSGNTLYASSRNGILYAVSKEGRLLWKFVTIDNIGIPLVRDGRIFVGSCDYAMYCLDLTGKKLWDFRTSGYAWWEPALIGTKLVFGSWDCLVRCIDITTKDLVWKFRTSGGPSYLPPANEAFQLELKVGGGEAEEKGGKSYQVNFAEEGAGEGGAYKSRMTYQTSTRYREKGKYQSSDEEEF